MWGIECDCAARRRGARRGSGLLVAWCWFVGLKVRVWMRGKEMILDRPA